MSDHSHFNEKGQFQSDKYPDLPPDKIVLSFNDPLAVSALLTLASSYHVKDKQLSADILKRITELYSIDSV